MATRVLLLRHAQSAWNVTGRWQGWADPPLSPDGLAAARAAAFEPVLATIDRVVSSDLRRASETATAIALARGLPPVTVFRGLRERGVGQWTGLTRAEIEDRWPGALDTAEVHIPGAEDKAAVTARGVATLHRIAEQCAGETVLAVSHGALIHLVEKYAGGELTHLPNLSGRWVTVTDHLDLGDAVSLQPVGSPP